MTHNYHTPIPNGAAANADSFNDPLGEMDEALTEALLLERDGHIIQDEGVDLAQMPRLNFTGAGVTVANSGGKSVVTIPGGVTAHNALSGLSADDHTQYLLTSGLRDWDEQASNPSTPATNKWKLFFKPSGLYYIDDAGVVLGPLDPTLFLAKTGLTQWDEQSSSPSSPAASKMLLYFKNDEKLYKKNSSGTETEIGAGGGAGTPTITSISPTTADVTVTVVTGGTVIHKADISGLTANRNYILPTATVGDRVKLILSTGDDTYALIIKGAATVTINGGSAATEWSRVRTTNEIVELVATSTTNWQVALDGRIPCAGGMSDLNPQNIANATYTKVTFDTSISNVGNMVDLVNDKLVIWRAGTYKISAQVYYHNFAAGALICSPYKNGAAISTAVAEESTLGMGTSSYGNPKLPIVYVTFAVGDYVELYGRQNSGSAQNPGMKPGAPCILTLEEVLS